MALTRRGFFGLLAGLPLLSHIPWSTARIPTPPAPVGLSLDDINAVLRRQIMPGVCDQYFASSPLLVYLRDSGTREVTSPAIQAPFSWPEATR